MKNRLKELRDGSKLTLQEVSILTGISVSAISRHESGERELNEYAIQKYSNLYKVPSHQLFFKFEKEDDQDI